MNSCGPIQINRRHFLQGLATAAALPLLGDCSLLQAQSATTKPTLHVYPDYGWLRGLGIVPSWAANIVDAWRLYDGARFREEVALARQIHANCIRLWIDYSAWTTDPEKVTESFLDAVAGIAENGMKVMPCLSNRWHDKKMDYGGTYAAAEKWDPHADYLTALVRPLVEDERILIWDLCNEPGSRDPSTKEFHWLSEVAAIVRGCGIKQPITIGTTSGANIVTFAPLVDVLNGHPYAHNPKGLEVLITTFETMSRDTGKPFLVNETIPGALDDRIRAEVARFYTEMLSSAGFGWMGWVIREGKAVATSREHHDGNGINGGGYHPFFTAEGKLRDGLDFLTEVPKRRAPWEKS